MTRLLHLLGSVGGAWASVIVGLLACGEAAAFIGLALPGETALLVGGFLARVGHAGLVSMIVAATLGAIVGGTIGFEIGRRLGPALRHSRLGRKVGEERWERSERYLSEKGGRAVFLGRWVGVLRALVPTVAGMSQMPYRTFLPYNVAGAVTWAPALVVTGYLAGSSLRRVEHLIGRGSLVVLGVVIAAVAVVVIVRRRHRASAQDGASGSTRHDARDDDAARPTPVRR
jgi:membrane protein DedA with SNARE-associated domain